MAALQMILTPRFLAALLSSIFGTCECYRWRCRSEHWRHWLVGRYDCWIAWQLLHGHADRLLVLAVVDNLVCYARQYTVSSSQHKVTESFRLYDASRMALLSHIPYRQSKGFCD